MRFRFLRVDEGHRPLRVMRIFYAFSVFRQGRGRCPHRPETLTREVSVPVGASPCPTNVSTYFMRMVYGMCGTRDLRFRFLRVDEGHRPLRVCAYFMQYCALISRKKSYCYEQTELPSIETGAMRCFSFSENLRFSECTLLSSVCCKFFL